MRERPRYFVMGALLSLAVFAGLLVYIDPELSRFSLARLRGDSWLSEDKRSIVETLKLYNSILCDFYASGGNPKLINKFPATTLMRHGVFRDLGYIQSADRILVYDLADSIPVNVSLTSPDKAEALRFEEWNYMYQTASDRTPVSSTRGLGQGIRYRLVREAGRWLVYEWDPVDVDKPETKTEFKF